MTPSWWPFRSKAPNGLIKFYGLTNWWLHDLSPDDRAIMQNTFRPLGGDEDSLTVGSVISNSQHVVGFLGNLAGWFNKPEAREIAYRILSKGQQLASTAPVLDQHFFWQQVLEVNYRDRELPARFDAAVAACRQQIALAPLTAEAFKSEYSDNQLPSHKGYEQLAIILENQKQYQDAIDLCNQAREQGWAGNWDNRIARCTKRIRKA